METGRRERGVPEHLGVVVRVDVDESGSDGAPGGVESPITLEVRTDLDDAVALHCNVGDDCRRTRPVDDMSTGDDHAVHRRSLSLGHGVHGVRQPPLPATSSLAASGPHEPGA